MKIRTIMNFPITSDGIDSSFALKQNYFFSTECANALIDQLAKQYKIVNRYNFMHKITVELEMEVLTDDNGTIQRR